LSSWYETFPVLILQGHQNSVISVAHSPAGMLFATGSGACLPPSSEREREGERGEGGRGRGRERERERAVKTVT
jgi:hypothetical protein